MYPREVLVDRYSSSSQKEYLGAMRGGGSVVQVSHSWDAYTDAAELAFFSKAVCLEGCKYSKMYLFITSSFCHIPLILLWLTAMPVVRFSQISPYIIPFLLANTNNALL